MSWTKRVVSWITGNSPLPERAAPVQATAVDLRYVAPHKGGQAVSRASTDTGLPPVDNDAEAYGVTVEPAEVPVGATFWRARRVHHLTPDENRGRHHIFLDAVNQRGERIYASQARVRWDGGESIITVDKPLNEPGTNFPMWKWMTCSVQMLGAPSDTVHGLSSSHPDEPNPDGSQSGNTLFHHSFLVEYELVEMPPADPVLPAPSRKSVISGTVTNGAGLTLQLLRQNTILAQGTLGESGIYRLRNLEAGTYTLRVVRTGESAVLASAGPLQLDGIQSLTVNLEVPPQQPSPAPIAPTPTPPEIEPTPEPLPAAPLLAHYLLFGAARASQTRILLILLSELLADQQYTFGFDPREAALARAVTIIGDRAAVPAAVESQLQEGGVQVRRIQGSTSDILAALQGSDHADRSTHPEPARPD